MTGKENYLNALRHLPTEWVPVEGEDLLYTGFEFNSMEKGPAGGGFDGFGVKWAAPESGGGTAIPEPGCFLLNADNVCDWKRILKFPEPAAYHWKEDAEAQLSGVCRETTCVDYGDGNGPYERLAAFMGFEHALMAMAEEPEAVEELLTAITDYKLECLEYVAEYYHPDTYTLYDDVATQQCTFMSPAAYRRLIKPQHKRLASRARELGMIPILHCCGHAEGLIEDFIEEGFAAWASVQPCNDIAGLLERCGDRFCIAGGYNTNGKPGMTRDEGVIAGEIARCWEAYGGKPGYIFAGFILLAAENPEDVWAVTGRMCELAIEYMHERADTAKK